MKKRAVCILLTMIALLSASVCLAEQTDLTALSVDELLSLRQRVNAELMTRPEAEDVVLEAGEYLVGTDLKPGNYYAIPANGGRQALQVFADSTMENSLHYYLCDSEFYEIQRIPLEEGNYVVVHGPVIMNLTGFPDYHIPLEGTTIPVGIYEIGNEIPAGKYSLYCNGVQANIYIYKNREDAVANSFLDNLYYQHLDYRSDNRLISVLYLEEGTWLVISESPVIMTKSTVTFTFE